jgi:hypothetical protein
LYLLGVAFVVAVVGEIMRGVRLVLVESVTRETCVLALVLGRGDAVCATQGAAAVAAAEVVESVV